MTSTISNPKTGGKMENCLPDVTRKIERSVAYMKQHLNEPLQVAALAAQASISPSHYFVLFKRQTGYAPIDYFIRLKMQHARQLLDTTPSSVKEIAAALGYNDPFYFSRVFKSVNEIAPSEYRLKDKNRETHFMGVGNYRKRTARTAIRKTETNSRKPTNLS
jgi:transcriptional regulator GlxA family with amidase domain